MGLRGVFLGRAALTNPSLFFHPPARWRPAPASAALSGSSLHSAPGLEQRRPVRRASRLAVDAQLGTVGGFELDHVFIDSLLRRTHQLYEFRYDGFLPPRPRSCRKS